MKAIFRNPTSILDEIQNFINDQNSLHGGVKEVLLTPAEWEKFETAFDDSPYLIRPEKGLMYLGVRVRRGS